MNVTVGPRGEYVKDMGTERPPLLGQFAPIRDAARCPLIVSQAFRTREEIETARDRSAAPGAARNAGLRRVTTELVAFLDSDCVPSPGWLGRLADHFTDPVVAALAPRIRPMRRAGPAPLLDQFVAFRSPLDLLGAEGGVTPGGRLAYVPTAALMVRREAVGEPFDPRLRHGEDVDLVWRLHDAGWRVRYDPSVTVEHDEPCTWRAYLGRRMRYGTSAAPSSLRHPRRLHHVVLRPWPTAAAALLLARRPLPALAIVAGQAALLMRRLAGAGVPPGRSLSWCVEAVTSTLLGVGRAATMLAPAVLAAAVCTRRGRGAALALVAAPALEEWLRRRPPLDPLRWTVACIADDVAYGTGVWLGCIRHRTARPLIPGTGR